MTRIKAAGSFRQLVPVLPVLAVLISISVLVRAQSPVDPAKPATDPTVSTTDSATAPANPVKSPADSTQPKVSPPSGSTDPTKSAGDPAKSAEALQTRIGRARALIAAHRLDTAASELESVRAATRDSMVRNITSIMLMSVYLEDGNYGRAEALLEENYQRRTAQKDESLGTYFALAGQAVNGARAHLTRYRNFGVNTADASLPAEAASDLNRLRSLVERMIAQAKEISKDRHAYDSLSLLEDVLGIRLSLARDSDDQARWETEYASARESLASSQTQIASLGGIPPLRPGQTPVSKVNGPSPYSTKKVGESPLDIKAPEKKDGSAAPQPAADGTATAPAAASRRLQVKWKQICSTAGYRRRFTERGGDQESRPELSAAGQAAWRRRAGQGLCDCRRGGKGGHHFAFRRANRATAGSGRRGTTVVVPSYVDQRPTPASERLYRLYLLALSPTSLAVSNQPVLRFRAALSMLT